MDWNPWYIIWQSIDDNTLGFWHNELDDLRSNFEYGSKIAIDWFQENHMKVNVSNFNQLSWSPRVLYLMLNFMYLVILWNPFPVLNCWGYRSTRGYPMTIIYPLFVPRRLIKSTPYAVSLNIRMSIYIAFIASNFNYCNTVWHFCSNRGLYKLEKIHKQALRVVLNDYFSSYCHLLCFQIKSHSNRGT